MIVGSMNGPIDIPTGSPAWRGLVMGWVNDPSTGPTTQALHLSRAGGVPAHGLGKRPKHGPNELSGSPRHDNYRAGLRHCRPPPTTPPSFHALRTLLSSVVEVSAEEERGGGGGGGRAEDEMERGGEERQGSEGLQKISPF